MVDSGIRISNGRVDFYNIYKDMVEFALTRPAEVDIQASWWRTGDHIDFYIRLTNIRDQAVGFEPGDFTGLFGIVYEENHIQLTNRFVRMTVEESGIKLDPHETRLIQLSTPDLVGVDWDRLNAVVIYDINKISNTYFESLQAAPAQRVEPSLSVAPESLLFMVDPDDAAGPAAGVQVLGGGFAEWTATTDRPWLRVDPAGGGPLDTTQVTIDKSALSPGWQEGTVTFTATDAGFSDTVAVRAYLGSIERLYVPVSTR